ncbi:hypothetical protein BDQ17DRAFT_1434315 [Cyathus striatus]|nr:hypothetical protein BDQ17DRAFT_1434315 [Cyathus striatus]
MSALGNTCYLTSHSVQLLHNIVLSTTPPRASLYILHVSRHRHHPTSCPAGKNGITPAPASPLRHNDEDLHSPILVPHLDDPVSSTPRRWHILFFYFHIPQPQHSATASMSLSSSSSRSSTQAPYLKTLTSYLRLTLPQATTATSWRGCLAPRRTVVLHHAEPLPSHDVDSIHHYPSTNNT